MAVRRPFHQHGTEDAAGGKTGRHDAVVDTVVFGTELIDGEPRINADIAAVAQTDQSDTGKKQYRIADVCVEEHDETDGRERER